MFGIRLEPDHLDAGALERLDVAFVLFERERQIGRTEPRGRDPFRERRGGRADDGALDHGAVAGTRGRVEGSDFRKERIPPEKAPGSSMCPMWPLCSRSRRREPGIPS